MPLLRVPLRESPSGSWGHLSGEPEHTQEPHGNEAHTPEGEGVRRPKTAVITLVGGERLMGVHPKGLCAGEFCCIHNPSDHHMREWRQHWRSDRHLMERICPHGCGHPDPDDPNPDTVHGCDGCCAS